MDLLYQMEREMKRRRYSPRTIEAYLTCVIRFLKMCKKEPRKITKKDAKDFLYYLSEKNYASGTMNLYQQAIKFALEEILNKKFYLRMPYARRPKRLPCVLSQEEVKLLIRCVENDKHRLMIELLYSAGLRVSELAKLKVKNLNLYGDYGWVRKGKGNKDRIFVIAKNIKPALIKQIKDKETEDYIFEGRRGHISIRTIYAIIKNAAKKAKIKKNVHPHTLRHSFATHLIENGYDVSKVQILMGHNSPSTTMVYVHTATSKILQVRSPLDDL